MCKRLICLFSFALVLSLTGSVWSGTSNPSPVDGAVVEGTWINITWTGGANAASFDVYFGDNLEDVTNGAGGTFRGNQDKTLNFFIAGFAGYPFPDGLVPGDTYYWRIDEVQTDGTVQQGSVWSFNIPSNKATEPNPADGTEFVDTGITLSWKPGFGAKLHTVYFGTDFDEVNNATGGTQQGVPSYTPSTLESEKVYYWRVDEFDGSAT